MKRFIVLAVVHVVVALALALSVSAAASGNNEPLIFSFLGVLLGQVSLLSVWTGLGNMSLSRRCAMICLAGSYLWAVFLTGADEWKRLDVEKACVAALLVLACLVPAIGIFLVLKRWGPRLILCAPRDVPSANKPLQFSTRHLLMLALVVSAALAAGRPVRAIDQSFGNRWFLFGLFCCVLGVCFIHALLAAVWACLSANKVFLRVPIALVAAALVGLVLPFYFRAPRFNEYLLCPMCFAIAQTVTVLSLLVARSAGYRVLRRQIQPIQPRADLVGLHPLD